LNKENFKFVYDFPKSLEDLSVIEKCKNAEERRLYELMEMYKKRPLEQFDIMRDINVLNEALEKKGKTPNYIID
jgi:hypothetical protein